MLDLIVGCLEQKKVAKEQKDTLVTWVILFWLGWIKGNALPYFKDRVIVDTEQAQPVASYPLGASELPDFRLLGTSVNLGDLRIGAKLPVPYKSKYFTNLLNVITPKSHVLATKLIVGQKVASLSELVAGMGCMN